MTEKTIQITIVSIFTLFVVLFLNLSLSKWIDKKVPIIQQIGVPFYFTNTIVVLVPTNSIPLTNVIAQP